MEEIKVSIIVPVYNGQDHIGSCIEALIKQDYKNIEIIIVNDGSTDKTASVVTEWGNKDERIVLINESNSGVSAARNNGIMTSSGKYILFVDSDDTLVSDAVKALMRFIQGNEELVFFGYQVIGDLNRKNDTLALKKLLSITKKDLKTELIKSIISTSNNIYGYIWRAMYSAELLKKNAIYFPEGIKISEDYMFLLNSTKHAREIAILPEELYRYNLGETSMSNKYVPSLLRDMNYVNDWMFENLVQNNISLYNGYYCSVANTYLRYVQNTMRNPDINFWKKNSEIKQTKQKYKFYVSINKVWNKPKMFDIKSKIGIIMFKFHLELFYEILFEIKEIFKGRK